MTNSDVTRIALAQSAADLNCAAEDFLSSENKTVISKANPSARKYLKLPFCLNLVSYGGNIVASASGEVIGIAEKYINSFSAEHCFETPQLFILDEYLKPLGKRICYMAEYFLPDLDKLQNFGCGYKLRILQPEELENLYTEEWSHALCKERKELDVLAVGAYDKGKLIGLSGCSADCDTMWQIGINVLPEYRRQGVASALTSKIAKETLARGKVPFYCAAWANIKSVKNALKCGFYPAWTELTAADDETVNKILINYARRNIQ